MEQEKAALSDLQPEDTVAAEIEKSFSYDGYQVVRRELFSHLREPAVTIRKDSTTFNTACINGLEDAVYIHFMLNKDKKILAIRKCEEDDKDAVRWCIAKPDKRRSRKITGKGFSELIYDLMGWDNDNRYKILGHRITFEGETIYVFILGSAEVFYNKKRVGKVNENATAEEIKELEEAAKKQEEAAKKVEAFNQERILSTFGMPVQEHEEALDIDIRDGFANINFKGMTPEHGMSDHPVLG